MNKNLMIQGTASSVGKSILTAAFCRIFYKDGYRVAPFKSQNMALNSFVTEDGLEMGRAQVVQAMACNRKPVVQMNPILMKPSTDKRAQIILEGKVHESMDAQDFFRFKPVLKEMIMNNYRYLAESSDVVVIEGAGSPAEINLKTDDIVNMGLAEMVDAPVILVADIDRGGVFASIAGTLLLLDENERERIKGVIINKFRGDVKLLEPGLKMLEDIIKKPVLGVIPYMNVDIEDEDSVTDRFSQKGRKEFNINIAVIRTPYMSNFTDFDAFAMYEDVNLRYVTSRDEFGDPDVIILPGSKTTIYDLSFIRNSGLEEKVIRHSRNGGLVIGICGGFQMLGTKIEDPCQVEGKVTQINGLGLLDISTVMQPDKVTRQVSLEIDTSVSAIFAELENKTVKGYEIHMGKTTGNVEKIAFAYNENQVSGVVKENVIGTYIHGIFDNCNFTDAILNKIRKQKNLAPGFSGQSFEDYRNSQFDILEQTVRDNVDVKAVYRILEGEDVECRY